MQVIASFAPLARVGLKDVIDLESKKRTNQWSVIADKISTKQQFERFDQIGDFSYATIAAEMGGVTYDTLDRGFTLDFYPLMRAIGFRISIQASYTDLYNKIKNPGPKLARAMDATMELEVANLLNNGFSSSYTGIDGVALFSTAHPLATTTTDVPAFVQQGRSKTLMDTGEEVGLRQVMELSLTRIYFNSDPGLVEHDYVTYVDSLGHTHEYVVTGWSEPGALSVFWQYDTEERA